MKNNLKIIISFLIIASLASFAEDQIKVKVLFRTIQLYKPLEPGLPQDIETQLRPETTTNIVLSAEQDHITPRELYNSLHRSNPFLHGMCILRYEPEMTNYVIVARFWGSNMRTSTNFVQNLKSDDILFFHGCVD
jgi:hypothetical protein